MFNELAEIGKLQELTDTDVKVLLKAEDILLTRNEDNFKKYTDRIHNICAKLDDSKQNLIAKYLAMLAFKNEQELNQLKRTPQLIAQRTGLKNQFMKQYASPRNQEAVVQIVRADASTCISDTILIRNFYRGILIDSSQPLFFRIKAAQALEASHASPRAKPSQFFKVEGDVAAQGDIYKATVYNPEGVPAFNSPDVRERIAAGERLLAARNGVQTIEQDGDDDG